MHGKHAPAVAAGTMLAVAATAVPAFASVATPPAGNDAVQPPVPDTLAAIQDVAHARPLLTRIVHVSARKTYTVRAGDTLSGIAGQFCGSSSKWPSLNHGNHSEVKDPNMIFPGQKILLTCSDPALVPVATVAAVAPAQAPVSGGDANDGKGGSYGHPYFCGDGDGDGYDVACAAPQQQAPVQAAATVTGVSGGGNVNPADYSGFQQCVIERESGGNSQVMNSSGHYGLYQFSESTWEAYGGSAADFGHASVAEQNQVFGTAMVQGGESNWAPYDGC